MKSILATAAVILAFASAPLVAADKNPAALSVEQRFQQADVELALKQYKLLRMAAFDAALKSETGNLSVEQRQELEKKHAQLKERAEELRMRTLKTAEVAATRTP